MSPSASSAVGDADCGVTIHIWRHPRAQGAEGRCIGRTDLPVDRRKAKRLAHRIRRWARQHGAARVVLTSSLQRATSVGRCLASWGWQHHIDPRLNEMDFGGWDGLRWDSIGAEAVGNQLAVIGNLTSASVTRQYASVPVQSFLTAYPANGGRPLSSNLNTAEGPAIPNMAILMYGTDATVTVYNLFGYAHYLFDASAVVMND